jgi:citronellol/citronellal dehydrogenase
VLTTPSRGFHGHFLIDENVLRERGVSEFGRYAVDASQPLLPDLFLDDPELEEALRR